jgi:class 3 adenylate cyclase
MFKSCKKRTRYQWATLGLLLVFSLNFFALRAQIGGAFFADFQLTGKGRQNNATCMVQDGEGNMQMATLAGVVVFDGSNTSLVGTGAQTWILDYVPENQKTYVGCDGRIGFIKRNSFGKFVFTRIPLKGVEDQGFYDIAVSGKDVYFQSSDLIVKVTDEKITAQWKRPSQGNFAGIFNIKNTLFVNVSSSGIYTLQPGGKFKKHAMDDSHLSEEELMFVCSRSENEVLLGTTANQIFVFNGASITELVCDKASYIQSKSLYDGKKLNNTYMVVSTLYGGILVLNMYNGIVSEMYNTGTGFPDDQIYSIAIDKGQGIWTNHELGFTRIDRNVPVKYFSAYPGITTRVYSVAEANGTLYAGCSDGLYRLKAVDNLDEYERALKAAQEIKKAQKESKAGSKSTTTDVPDEPGESNPTEPINPTIGPTGPTETPTPDETAIDRAGKKIKGIWKRVKDKIPGSTGDGTGGGQLNPKGYGSYSNSPISFERVYRNTGIFHLAVIGEDKGAQYIYSKVEGINSKVKKILTTPTGLICITNTGLFEYTGTGVKKLFNGEIKDAVYSEGRIFLVSSTGPFVIESDGTSTYIAVNTRYKSLSTVFLENANTLWIGGTNHVIKITLGSHGSVVKEKLIEIPAEFPDYMSICKSGDVIFFVSGGGLFEYQPSTESAVLAQQVQATDNEILEYVINPAGNTLFIKSVEGWKEVKNHNEKADMGLLDVLNDVRYVYKSNNGNVWAVSNRGDIYFLNRNIPAGSSFSGFDVYIRGFLGGFNGNPYNLSDLDISYREGAIEIKWGSNLYLKSDGTWYRYKIEGSGRSQWSQWTRQTSLKIQLTPGSYTFIVQAKDILGNLSPERKISFYIKPPFWQTWWFYTIMAIVLAGIIYFIFRWRNRALLENQKRLEAMVVERTTELAEEKEKTEDLLLNILPKAVAQELKELGQSRVRRHPESAVMFTDFCNFTKMSMNMTAEELVEKLDHYFRKFDEIVDKYGLEKIKTIGDAYMCAAGVPQPRKNYSLAIVMAALEIIDVVANAEAHWQIRVGIHQGGLVSGVVGKRKFAYDIWGDTVNVASRMESSSEPMNINITEQVFDQIKDYFVCEKRGEVEAKSLGKTNMYFVKGLKSAFCANGSPLVPNKEFLALLN